ncbi:extracellular lipase, putative [Talaromyces stipitatus ATCC 10500]|uniref:Carboxylic ester hydrolase n=1 Tax=Talaromyces stipitatus (strain ATCC 10500 / CBS 375.48 / QM 6759 / NRRL 1006) TaxID=441959 RepID=B8MPB0_TALSN|nr:extracellular lipase, putative [Talaromyces stipitatus ATCC 10500]EED14349.1 extracellular lipase, putative [Talaromyces stipitatus ATCC 10500]
MKWSITILSLVLVPYAAEAAPVEEFVKRGTSPTVTIAAPSATIVGSTYGNVDTFNGIPFAKPPTGSLRLRPPQALTSGLGTVTATGTAQSCPQMFFSASWSSLTGILGELLNTPLFQDITDAGEDCLTVNVVRPKGASSTSKLPVLFWIFGGGFELGGTSTYNGATIVENAIANGKPIVFVAVNYRVGGFGFLAGKEILADGSSNLGLLDQRLGLQWVADNIAQFGGDPTKVTIWGESAGSISVLDQMLLYDGDNIYKGQPLFRGAIMNSGSIVPTSRVDGDAAQKVYDSVVSAAGCSSASNTLECLRGLDYTAYLNAANSVPGILSYNSVALSYLPRPDGTALTDSPEILIKEGKYAPVPFIVGDQEDEGTLFALFQSNLTTTQQVIDYLQSIFFSWDGNQTIVEGLVKIYPDDIAFGSPFRTGILNNWYPQFKRLAAILGDAVFTLTRRAFLNLATAANPNVPSWSYLSSYDYGTPILGTGHGTDILQVFYGILPNYASKSIWSYYLSFVYELDPNANTTYPNWPQWSAGKQLMNFQANSAKTVADNFRQTQYDVGAAANL